MASDAKKLTGLQRWLGRKCSEEGSFDRKIPRRVGRLRSVQVSPQAGGEKDSPGKSLWDCGPRALTHPLSCSSKSKPRQSLFSVFRIEASLGYESFEAIFHRWVPNLVRWGEDRIGSKMLLDIYFKLLLLPPGQCQETWLVGLSHQRYCFCTCPFHRLSV